MNAAITLALGTVSLLLAGYAGYLIGAHRRANVTFKQSASGEHSVKFAVDASATTNEVYLRTVSVKNGATVSTITMRNPSEVETLAEQLERAAGFAMSSRSILKRTVKVE